MVWERPGGQKTLWNTVLRQYELWTNLCMSNGSKGFVILTDLSNCCISNVGCFFIKIFSSSYSLPKNKHPYIEHVCDVGCSMHISSLISNILSNRNDPFCMSFFLQKAEHAFFQLEHEHLTWQCLSRLWWRPSTIPIEAGTSTTCFKHCSFTARKKQQQKQRRKKRKNTQAANYFDK